MARIINALMIMSCLALAVQAGNISKNILNHDDDFQNLEATSVLSVHPTLAGSVDHGSHTGGSLVGGTLLDKRPRVPTTAGMASDSGKAENTEEYLRFSIPQDNDDDMVLRLYRAKIFANGA